MYGIASSSLVVLCIFIQSITFGSHCISSIFVSISVIVRQFCLKSCTISQLLARASPGYMLAVINTFSLHSATCHNSPRHLMTHVDMSFRCSCCRLHVFARGCVSTNHRSSLRVRQVLERLCRLLSASIELSVNCSCNKLQHY